MKTLPGREITTGITHVILAFANSSIFTTSPAGEYTPFMSVTEVRAMFDEGVKVGIAIGGWSDNAGFGEGSQTQETRMTWAKNVADMCVKYGFDFVDIDWEYAGGNGADYKTNPNSGKTVEICAFPEMLTLLREQLHPLGKELSIASPGLERDMIAYTAENNPTIFGSVDMVNIMTYDLTNRRDTVTGHHSSVKASLEIIRRYKELGLESSKINLGLAYYAKFFQTQPGVKCSGPTGCAMVKAENDDGSDAGTSGSMTFESQNVCPPPIPSILVPSMDGSCGVGTSNTCAGLGSDMSCCSQYGFCGGSAEHCGLGCQHGFGHCEGPDVSKSFSVALAEGQCDDAEGGMWYWDEQSEIFWTWDDVQFIRQKFTDIVDAEELGGVMAWSLGEDSDGWSRVVETQQCASELSAQRTGAAKARRGAGRKL
ncbi:family 18 glycosyl hydrolase [Biscogniauxia sp. FL1348]|nr:family 18 glycosyl hydrolase [Biscogniauxia sp. FL1348]